MAKRDNKEIKEAIKIVNEMSMDKKERELYEARLKGEFNYNTAIYVAKEEGKEEGEKKKQIEIAKKMLSKKMPIEEIIEITGLSKNDIEETKTKPKTISPYKKY